MASLGNKWVPPGRLRVDLDGTWSNLKGEIDGELAYIRVNSALKSVAGHPEYDHRLIVSILLNDVREDGMPASKEEFAAIDQVEDVYRQTLQVRQESLLAAVVTTNGRRDLIFYSSNPQQAIHKFENDLQPLAETHQVEFMVHPDPGWDLYYDFSESRGFRPRKNPANSGLRLGRRGRNREEAVYGTAVNLRIPF